MPPEVTLFSAFLVGLLGSTHCIAMCGGIVAVLTLGLPENTRRSYWKLIPYLFTYNLGRLLSYTTAGAIVGLIGAQTNNLLPTIQSYQIGKWVAGLFMIALGLYLASWWQGLTVLEKGGARLWRHLEPIGRHLLPVKDPIHALALGIIWGWLPCSLVYAVLIWSLVIGDPLHSGLLMLAFGIGTVPVLLVIGTLANWLGNFVRYPIVRRLAGTLIILFGLYFLFMPHHHPAPSVSSPAQPAANAEAAPPALDHHHH